MPRNAAIVLTIASLLTAVGTAGADDVGTAFTYQGELEDNGTPVNADCDFEFTLWDMPDTGTGTQIGSAVAKTVTVTDGRFTEQLDFGDDRFQGSPRYLQIQVCCPSVCAPGYTLLDPRQELTPTPYALALPAMSAGTQVKSVSSELLSGALERGLVQATMSSANASLQSSASTT